jgi:predicted metal-binding protein
VNKFQQLQQTLKVSDFIEKFLDESASTRLCKGCENYGSKWSCPPFAKKVDFQKYQNICVYLRRVENDGALEKTYYNSRKIFDEFMLAQESVKQGSLALFAGSCVNCPLEKCARLDKKECPFNNKMRTSLEALGFDVSKIAKDVFNTEILWSSNNSQPTYTTLVAGLFFD